MQIFDSYIEAGLHMKEREKQAYFSALCMYLYDGTEPDLKGAALAVFTAIKPSLDNTKARSEAGKAGGRPKSKTKPDSGFAFDENSVETEKQNESKTKPDSDFAFDKNAKANSNSKGNSNDKETTPKGVVKKAQKPRFSPPTVSDVAEYAREKGYSIDAQCFVGFYESKGWKVGTSPMRDWRAAVLTWVRRDGRGRDSFLGANDAGEGW